MKHTVYLYDQHGRLVVQGKYRPKFSMGDGPKSVLPELEGETWYCIPLWHSGASMALGTRYADIGYLLTYYVPFSINPGIGLATRSGIIGGGDWEITIQPDKKFDPEFQLVNYYDDYGFLDLEGFKDKAYFTAPAANGRGQLTGNMTATTDGKTKLYSVYHYDKYGREVKRVEENILGGYDVTETTYTFTGKPLVVTHTHNVPGKNTITEKYAYSYDTGDRLQEVKHSLDGKADVVLASYTYDEFGRMKDKQLHGGAAQQVDYSYNLRGWLTGIDGEKFTQSLYYNTGNGTPAYNGNISSMTWKAGDETAVRGYKFTYDALSRLKNAAYGEGTALSSNTGRFSENVTNYDLNGNITGLQRYGQTGSSYGLVDNLTFTLNGNQLNRVDDSANGGLFEDAVKQANEYAYDRNANMTKDLNRNISGITYNSLNLPSKTTFTDGSTIASTYLVDGTKLNTVRTIGGATTTTDYCGNAVYENGTLKYLLTEEGYITVPDKKYHYYLRDHQGNNRVVVDQAGNVEEVNHYYPFGGMFASTDVQPYKYNGKEWDEDARWYDYGARSYDPTLGRFTTVDPMAESYHSTGTYVYCLNNPIKLVDPTGCFASTHTDSLGNVVEVFNDEDYGVYKHNTDEEGTRDELSKSYSSDNTAAGGIKMGTTKDWDEFLDTSTGKPFEGMVIKFDRSFDTEFADYAALASTMDIITLAKESKGNGKLDIKKKIGNIGGMFRGKYVTSRSLGNYLAGYNAAKANISFEAFQRLAGALHIEENFGQSSLTPLQMLNIVLFGTYNSSRPEMFKAPTWGEIYYQYRMSKRGWNEGIR